MFLAAASIHSSEHSPQDKHQIKPAYPFGHGLTYGTATYSQLKIVGRKISFTVSTTGGCDTPQVYISYPTAATDAAVPAKVLRGFKKVGERTSVFHCLSLYCHCLSVCQCLSMCCHCLSAPP